MMTDIEPYSNTWIMKTKTPYQTALFYAIVQTSLLCVVNLEVSSDSLANALTVRTFPKASSATLDILALSSYISLVNFFIWRPKNVAKMTRGKMPHKVTPVSSGLKIIKITSVQMMKIKARTNMLTLVARQSQITWISEFILDRRSPVLRSSKNATSLFIIESKQSKRSLRLILSAMMLNVQARQPAIAPEQQTIMNRWRQ